MRRWWARSAWRVLLAVVVVIAVPGRAHADPAGPTDYRSEVASIDPAVDGVTIDVLGGDSFLRLSVDPGVEAVVVGYFGEPYLWFLADGTVRENRRSPTTYQNEERYGADTPAFADATADPDWVDVANDGAYAWHDHRAHWMQPIRPAGLAPGDQILEQVVPITVDGVDVDVTVVSTWLPAPSTAPLWLGVVVGLLALTGAEVLRRRGGPWHAIALPVAVAASVVGWWQYLSLPGETGPRLVWPALPTLAVVATLVGVAARRRSPFAATASALVAGVELAVWGWVKRDGLMAAIIPTNAPGWLDRGVVVTAFVVGVGLAVLAVRDLFIATPGTRRELATTSMV